MAPHHDIFQCGHIMEKLDVLKRPGNPAGGNLVRLAVLDRGSVERHQTGGGGKGARNQIEKRCLPGAVGTDDRFDGPFFYPKANVVDRMQSAEFFVQPGYVKECHRLPSRFLPCCRNDGIIRGNNRASSG